MRISAPDSTATRAQAADWFELNALLSLQRGYTYESLIGALNLQEQPDEIIEDEGGVVEDEILETKYDEFCEQLLTELEWRSSVLGPLYPFEVLRSGPSWRLVMAPGASSGDRISHETYVLCLLISAIRYRFLEGEPFKERWKTAPRIFQILSHLASRGLLGGSTSFWMGFPRPEKDGYDAAIARLIAEVGVGKVKEKPPVSQQGFNKDAGIDVIAWHSFADGRPSPLLAYGQVASGRDWKDKPVDALLDSHFHYWLEDKPVNHHISALYIPFMQHDDVEPRLGATFDEVAFDALYALELRLGLVLDRTRLTELAPIALMRATEEDRAMFMEVTRWCATTLREIRSEALVL